MDRACIAPTLTTTFGASFLVLYTINGLKVHTIEYQHNHNNQYIERGAHRELLESELWRRRARIVHFGTFQVLKNCFFFCCKNWCFFQYKFLTAKRNSSVQCQANVQGFLWRRRLALSRSEVSQLVWRRRQIQQRQQPPPSSKQ